MAVSREVVLAVLVLGGDVEDYECMGNRSGHLLDGRRRDVFF